MYRQRVSLVAYLVLFCVFFAGPQAAFAQQQPPQPKPEEEKPKEEPKDPFAEGDKKDEKKLVDAEGREYRVCPQCAYNMYKQGRMWVCENCGYSYVE